MSNDKYIHTDVEDKIYSYWEKNNLFKPTKNKKQFSVVIPPPNVTGSLHMGHALNNSIQDLDFIRLDEESFNSINSESIDYAVMEKSNNAIVIPLDVNWNDLGSWKALYDVGAKDVNGNVVNGDVITEDTSDCYIYGKHHMIATIGLKGITIVDTPNATLIANNNKIHNR